MKLSDIEKKAWQFAHDAHEGVKRKFSGSPYFYHVRQVFKLVKKQDTDENIGAAALLHDTVEDVEHITNDMIRKEFNDKVADLVKELTSTKEMVNLMGKPEYLLDKMFNMSDDALLIKLCDRLHNISDHYNSSDSFRKKYYKETKYIIDNLKKERQLNRKQQVVCDQIEGALKIMKSRYIVERHKWILNK